MNKPASKQPRLKPFPPFTSPAHKTTRAPAHKPRRIKANTRHQTRHQALLLVLEVLGLTITGLYATISALGYTAHRLSGANLFANILPFAISLLAFILLTALILLGWLKLRSALKQQAAILLPIIAICLACMSSWLGTQQSFSQTLGHFRLLLGGKQEASRVTLTHQIYAAYRRHPTAQLQQLIARSQPYQSVIIEATQSFGLDINLLQGVAAAESSFLPRDSLDGGHGLFQITRVPKAATAIAAKRLQVTQFNLDDPRHNAYLAAATLAHYLKEMQGDLFLGLLAYNIGPENGGLRFIMQKYGVTDFVTIQPYLQQLPRDYPIRVLTYALAFRLWQQTGKIPSYEKGQNALLVQKIGIPGLQTKL